MDRRGGGQPGAQVKELADPLAAGTGHSLGQERPVLLDHLGQRRVDPQQHVGLGPVRGKMVLAAQHARIHAGRVRRRRVDEVRAGCDAIMVGAVTLRRDNPRLRVKSPKRRAARKERGLPEELLRVIVTRSGKLGRDLRVWTSAGEKIIYCPDTAVGALRETLGDLAVVVGQGDAVDLGALLDDLGTRGIGRLMVEGGEQVHTQFLAADLADELHVTIGGFFVADPAAPRFVTPGVRLPQNAARRMRLIEVSRAGETAVLRYMVRPKALSSPSRVPTRAAPPPKPAGRVVFAAVRRCRTHRAGRRVSRFGNH